MEFSVSVDCMFRGKDSIYEGIETLGNGGIRNLEFWGWYDKDLNRLLEYKKRYQFRYIGLCTKDLSMVKREGIAEYVDEFRKACEFAQKIDCPNIFVKPGDKTKEPYEEQYAVMMEILKQCTAIAQDTGRIVLLEPVSYQEAPETFLGMSDLAFEMVKKINNPHLRVLYDIFHMQQDEGDVMNRILKNLPWIGHIHTAGIRSRNELDDGEVNYPYIFRRLKEAGYDKYIGLEYIPTRDPVAEIHKLMRENE